MSSNTTATTSVMSFNTTDTTSVTAFTTTAPPLKCPPPPPLPLL
jgi:hypothetical protein